MDQDGYPTEETIKRIENWDWKEDRFLGLADLIHQIWHFSGAALFRDWAKDEFGDEYRELRLATCGWSGNESIISALDRNRMFNALCWQSSHRGGLHIYHIRKIPPATS